MFQGSDDDADASKHVGDILYNVSTPTCFKALTMMRMHRNM